VVGGSAAAPTDRDILPRSVPAAAPPREHTGPASRRFYLVVKRFIDLSAAALGLTLLSPLMIVVSLLIKLTSPGPVLFGHKRQGLRGREFRCWKFRSMRQDADAMQAKLRALNEVDGPQFKIANDPRVTRIGHWLRATNLDELPQLINVLLGQMSLVGPRPSPDKENQLCPAWRRTRLSVRPGITGLWQVLRRRNRPESDFQEWIYYDVEYARHQSLWLDWQILIHTPISILFPLRMDAFARFLERNGICVHSDRLRQEHDQMAAMKSSVSVQEFA
jgi:lipopolysaccharide/colanic/teichoic acid biosynthesis glycosyltransferase